MKIRTKILLLVLAVTVFITAIVVVGCKKQAQNTDLPQNPPENGTQSEPSENPEKATVIFEGADDVEIVQGKFFDYFSGVTAVSENGNDLTSYMTVYGDLNTSRVGEYTLVYSVTDDDGNTAKKERAVSVISNPSVGQVAPVPVYTLTDGGTYNIAKGCVTESNSSLSRSSYANDGDFSTRWESVHGQDNVWFTVDLGAILNVEDVAVYWEAAYATDFELLASDDGEVWTALKNISGQTLYPANGTDACLNAFSFEDLTARYIRIQCKHRATNYGYSIYEIQVFGPTGTVIPEEEYPDLFSAEQEGSPDWGIADNQWLELDLGAVNSVDTMRLAFRDYLTPASYAVYYAGADKVYKQITLKNLPYSADTFSFSTDGEDNLTLTARYFRIEMYARKFYTSAYRINEVSLRYGNTSKQVSSISASSNLPERGAELAIDGSDATYWENYNDNSYQQIDLGEVKPIGRVDLYWRSDDGGKGKYYDLQISSDGESWTTIFRQTHGDTAKQSVYVYAVARYIRVIDYQSADTYRYMLNGIVVHSQYPSSSGEGKVEYDTTLSFPEYSVIETQNGSYLTGGTDFPSSRLIAYLDDSLRDSPVPSNDWWQGLLIADKGYNMYMNPLTATFTGEGLWLTNPGEGYFDGFVPGNGSQTVDVDAHDLAIGYAGMSNDAKVRVTGYSDYGISAVMTDDKDVDKLTVFLAEGALYAYCLFAEPEKALLQAADLVAVFDLDGNEILTKAGSAYTGDAIVLMVRTHSGYESGIRKYLDENGVVHENAPLYEERYYVVSVPANTKFVLGDGAVSVIMTEGNYMSVGAVGQKNTVKEGERSSARFPLEEANLLHAHGYAFVIGTTCLYSFDGQTNTVTTQFMLRTVLMRSGYSAQAYSAYLPHQLEKSSYDGGYVYPSVRGNMRSYAGNMFETQDTFYGIVPTFAEPTDSGYSASYLYEQLLTVYNNNGGDKSPRESNLISGDPYWQGKNLHPMAMAAIAADQIGATDLRDSFLDKIEYILTDWFTYDPVQDAETGAYFYYDSEWGTLYYQNSEFGAGVNLADHYFTYGYYTLAAGVLSAYRPEFVVKYGDMIELLIRDYMNWQRDDELFPYMRNFDMFAGHGWAGGYADNNGGNNQESAGEALNSWVGAYLYATAVGNEDIRIAAIYGYTTELNAVKHYWFNYFGDFSESYQYGVAGQVYGGSNFYGTFFNGQPLYMYGIHLIPGEEYLTSYALNAYERDRLENLIENMRAEQAIWDVSESEQSIYAWQHIFIPIVAIYNADEAIEWYEALLQTQGNVGNDSEQFNVYWLIHGMNSAGVRTTDIWAENGASATVYEKDGVYTAICWNPTQTDVRFVFRNSRGVVGSAVVPPHSLVYCDPTAVTLTFNSYSEASEFALTDYAEANNATVAADEICLGADASVTYLLTFGSSDVYRVAKIASADEGVRLLIDGEEVELYKTAYGYESQPLTLAFKHTVTLCGSGAQVTELLFEERGLVLAEVQMSASASSQENAVNVAQNAVDGDKDTRWESQQGNDNEWLLIELDEATTVYQLKIYWETASAKEYKVYFSETNDSQSRVEVFSGNYSQTLRTDVVTPSEIMQVKHIYIECISRTTPYGYSVYEVELYNLSD